jgi:hypothetical protein
MREIQVLEDIFQLIRKLWSQSNISVGRIIHAAVDPVVANEIKSVSDITLQRLLQAMVHDSSSYSSKNDKATSNWLQLQLRKLRKKIAAKESVTTNNLKDIFQLLRKLWSQSDASVAQLIYLAVNPAIANEIQSVSDLALRKLLRAMVHYSNPSSDTAIVTQEHLAALDEARDYDAASSYNWLRSELRKLCKRVAMGESLTINSEEGTLILTDVKSFTDWVQSRYPGIHESELTENS